MIDLADCCDCKHRQHNLPVLVVTAMTADKKMCNAIIVTVATFGDLSLHYFFSDLSCCPCAKAP